MDSEGKFSAKAATVDERAGSSVEVSWGGTEELLKQDMLVRKIGESLYQLGSVVLDQKARTITIPATVNMVDGMIEYALVSHDGKVHESLFATTATPRQVHVAALLLGMEPQRAEVSKTGGLQVPEKCRINVEVSWAKHGPPARYRLDELVLENSEQGMPRQLAGSEWFYSSSQFRLGRFVAQQEGGFVALISDQSALVNNPRSNRMRDDVFSPNGRLLPAKGTQVKIVFKLPALEEAGR